MCFKRGCHATVIDWGGCQWICISQQDPVKGGKNGETPLNWTKPTEIFSLMEVGLTAVAKRTASKLCLTSEAWVSAELLYNSTPIGSERKRQLNPLLGGGGCRGVDSVERRGSSRGSVHGGKKTSTAPMERMCSKTRDLNKCDNKIRATKVYNMEEKARLDNEGLPYSCHGDEQVSQASSFLWLLPWTPGIKIDMGREQRAI